MNRRLILLPNPIGDAYFSTKPLASGTNRTGAVFIANNLRDPNKNLALVLETLENIGFPLTLIGHGNPEIRSSTQNLGPLSPGAMIHKLDQSRYLIVASISETSPLVIAEAAARGTIPVISESLRGCVENAIEAESFFFHDSEELKSIVSQTPTPDFAERHRRLIRASKERRAVEIAKKFLEIYQSK